MVGTDVIDLFFHDMLTSEADKLNISTGRQLPVGMKDLPSPQAVHTNGHVNKVSRPRARRRPACVRESDDLPVQLMFRFIV